jgi:hypothetical protein
MGENMQLKSLNINLMVYGEFEGQYQGKIEFAELDPQNRYSEKQHHALTLSNESCQRIVALAATGLLEEADTLAKAMVTAVTAHNHALLERHEAERLAIEG